jgi:signal transduction histidine kinase
VSVSVSGDRGPDERDRLLVAATGEAVRNAVRHGAPPVRVLAEFGPRGAARVWVADHGPGFDLEQVPEDRLGVRDSIRGRMRRAGGRAMLAPGGGGRGEGTEWELVLPDHDPPADARTGSEPGPGSAGT